MIFQKQSSFQTSTYVLFVLEVGLFRAAIDSERYLQFDVGRKTVAGRPKKIEGGGGDGG